MFGTVRVMVFFVIELKSRAVHIAGMRVDPDGAWMTQIARNLLDPADGFLRDATHLIHDRDPLFTKAWTTILESGGVASLPIPAHSPNCNPYAERFVKTVRTECTNHFLVFGRGTCGTCSKNSCATIRPSAITNGRLIYSLPAPNNDNAALSAIRVRSRLGGLLNYYHRAAA